MEMAGPWGNRSGRNQTLGQGWEAENKEERIKREKLSVAAKGSGTKEFPKPCYAPPTSQGVLSALIMFQIRGKVN